MLCTLHIVIHQMDVMLCTQHTTQLPTEWGEMSENNIMLFFSFPCDI